MLLMCSFHCLLLPQVPSR
uniref:Uncharacterized protein n=1 Tax=Arundo donax TaxID=35708 RepID=A0A0A9AHX2_ARUDO